MKRFLSVLFACGVLTASCGGEATPAAQPTPSSTVTPRAFLPAFQSGADQTPLPATTTQRARVLFVNGDHLPESGYPHSRVRDAGDKPESFSRLREEVLEGDLGLEVDEFILTSANALSAEQLAPYRLVVLGANGRVLTADEIKALTDFYTNGGRILIYADFQYGPENWNSDNSFLNAFGIEVFPDNFQPATTIEDLDTSHPIMAGVRAFGVEGASQFRISASALSSVRVLARCTPLERSGCAVQPAEQARIQPGDQVVCTWVRELPNGGKLAGTCDRNTFHNGPGPGSDLDQHDNRTYARNLFRWLTE